MKTKEEGYIKFNLEWENKAIDLPNKEFEILSYWRTLLFDKGLIGETNEGIGYGNISIRYKNGFIISGSTTGRHRILNNEGYSYVTSWNIKLNNIKCVGKVKASSESLSHAALYESNRDIGAAIHIHNNILWSKYIDVFPTTDKDAMFGTPEMANSLIKIVKEHKDAQQGIIIMGGHEDGIIIYGKNIDTTGKLLISFD